MMHGTVLSLLKTLALISCAIGLLSSIESANAGAKQTLRFTHINKEQGLQDGSVPAIYQDKQGLMWLGTASGLVRYDGRHMRRWGADPEDPRSLSNPLVTALQEGKQDELWIGTSAGLDRLNLQTEQIERIAMPSSMSLQQRRIWALAPNIDEKIWIASQFTLLRFDPKGAPDQQFSTIPLEGEKGALIRSLISDQAGGAWAAVGSKISHVNATGQVVQTFDAASVAPNSPKVNFSVRSMTLDHQGKLWIGMHGGVQVWDVSNQKPTPDPITERLNLKVARVFAMFMDEEKSIWIGYGDGHALVRVKRLPSEEVEIFRNYPALPSSLGGNSIASIFQDRAGTLWVGTWGMGVSLVDLRKKGFTSYTHLAEEEKSLSNNSVLALSVEDHEKVWVGTYGGGLNFLNLKTGDAEHISNSLTGSPSIKALLRSSHQEMWIGGDDGLKVFNLHTKKLRTISLVLDTPGAGSISSLIRDHNGDVWAGSAAGLYRINPQFELKTYKANASVAGSLTHDTVDCLLEDKEHNLWIGSKGGLQRWDHKTQSFSQAVKPSATLKNPAGLSIYGLHQDDKDRIWVGTSVGLFQLIRNNDQWQLHSWRNVKGMPEGWVITIQHDDQGDLWLGGEQGLIHLKLNQNQARLYTNDDGPIDGSFSFGAIAKLSDGRLLFGVDGLLAFNPRELKDNDTPVQVDRKSVV